MGVYGWLTRIFSIKIKSILEIWEEDFSARSSRSMMIISQSNSIWNLLFFEFNHGLNINSRSSKLPLRESKIIWNWQNEEKKTGMTNCSSWSIFSLLLPSMAKTVVIVIFGRDNLTNILTHILWSIFLSFIHRWFKTQLKYSQQKERNDDDRRFSATANFNAKFKEYFCTLAVTSFKFDNRHKRTS